MLKCPQCDFQIESINSLRIHASKKHDISSEDLYIQVVLKGIKPTCECGCGSDTKFNGLVNGYSKFVWGHASKVNNNWGHNKEAFKKSLTTRRKMWENGEIQGWCKGLTKDDPRIASIIEKMNTPERSEKISRSLTGKSKSESHKQKISEHMKSYWGKETNRERQSLEQAERVKNGLLTKCTRVHGYFNNSKKSSKPNVYYRSLFELNAILHLESNEDVISYTFEPYNIEYSFEGKIRHYIIDCLIEYKDGTKRIVEFKPNCHVTHDKNVAKFQSAQKFATENGFIFEIWTEKSHRFLSS
jgi:hypothetical protein